MVATITCFGSQVPIQKGNSCDYSKLYKYLIILKTINETAENATLLMLTLVFTSYAEYNASF